jgi:hypothetical protein
MRLRSTLFDIAAIVTATSGSTGCGSRVLGTTPVPGVSALDASPGDSTILAESAPEASPLPELAAETGQPADAPFDGPFESGQAAGSDLCDAGEATRGVTSDEACALVANDRPFESTNPVNSVFGTACNDFCDLVCPGVHIQRCELPQAYLDAYYGIRPDGGNVFPPFETGIEAGLVCLSWSDPIVVRCVPPPMGRRTENAMHRTRKVVPRTVGAEFAERAYLEAVSVHAFATLERELARYGAPLSILRDVRRARRDEIRHTSLMARLARRFGSPPPLFESPPLAPVRGLLAISRENAVEGCVRETYGAVVALVEARTSPDPQVRLTMRRIAIDECRHAELAWAIAAWIEPKLTTEERRRVRRATREAVVALGREGDTRIVQQLAERVWTRARAIV